MKIILSFLIIVQIYSCDCSVYDWNIKTIDRDSDFDDDLKVQTALNNELQKDLRKISGKSDDNDDDDFDYYNSKKPYDWTKYPFDENRKFQDSFANNYKKDSKYNKKKFNRKEYVDQQNYLNYKKPHYNDYREDIESDDNDDDDDKHHYPNQRYHCSNKDHSSDQIDRKHNNNENHYNNYMSSDDFDKHFNKEDKDHSSDQIDHKHNNNDNRYNNYMSSDDFDKHYNKEDNHYIHIDHDSSIDLDNSDHHNDNWAEKNDRKNKNDDDHSECDLNKPQHKDDNKDTNKGENYKNTDNKSDLNKPQHKDDNKDTNKGENNKNNDDDHNKNDLNKPQHKDDNKDTNKGENNKNTDDDHNLCDLNKPQHNDDNKDTNKEDNNKPTDTKKEKEKEKPTNNDKNQDYALITTHCPAKGPEIENFVGTNLFDKAPKKCFSTEELALLNARRDFESLIPKDLPQCLLNDRMAAVLMKYFYICHEMIMKMASDGTKDLAQKAYYDTLGGYLNYYLVPVAKYSFYAGHASLNTVKNILTLHKHCRTFLNTQGNGWKAPLKNVLNELKKVRIEPLHIDEGKKCEEPSFCMHLDLSSNQNGPDDDKLIVPIPNLEADDSNGYLGNILLPFKRKRTFDLRSDNSAYVVVKFYETLSKCYQFQNISQVSYNKKFRSWLLENIHIHLPDEQFYPGLGAVLRIYEFLKRGKKEITIYGDEFGTAEFDDEVRLQDRHNWNRKLERESNLERENTRNYMKSNELYDILGKSKLLQKKSNAEKDKAENDDNNLFNRDESQEHSDDNNEYQEQERKLKEKLSKLPVKQSASTKVEAVKSEATAIQTPLAAPVVPVSAPNPLIKIRTLDLTPTQLYVIAIPAVAFVLIFLICCYKCCCKKKKLPPKKGKDSSSSSSNLINSPVRFFYVKPKSPSGKSTTTVDYSTSNKGKKSVKIDKKGHHTDTSASSSPKKNKTNVKNKK